MACGGMLEKDFNAIYHLDLKGNVAPRRPEASGNVYNGSDTGRALGSPCCRAGDGITAAGVHLPRGSELLAPRMKRGTRLVATSCTTSIRRKFRRIAKHNWLDRGAVRKETRSFMRMSGYRRQEQRRSIPRPPVFRSSFSGCRANRDEWAYDFHEVSTAGEGPALHRDL